MSSDATLFSSGIPALDRVLGGGIPPRQVLLIAGQPGSGKTILASQIAFAQAARGVPVLLATAASEPHTKILESLQGFSFFNRERVGREIFLLSVYPWLRKGVREAREMLLSSVRERKARLLVVDGLRSLRDVWRDEAQIREFLAEVGVGIASNDCTGLFTLEAAPDRILELPEAATVDGVATLSFEPTGMTRARRLEVVKIRGRQHLPGRHSAKVGPNGFSLSPRIEALDLDGERSAPQADRRRAGFGLAGLDTFLHDGLPGGSVTALVGEGGTGKSILAAAFAHAGAAAGEKTLFVTLHDDAGSISDHARAAGAPAPAAGALELWAPSPVAIDPDVIAHAILDRASAAGARRIVLDGGDALDAALDPLTRRRDFWFAFARCLGHQGRDVLVTFTTATPASTAVAAVDPVLAPVFDNVLSARLGEENGALVRDLRAIKLQSGAAPGRPWRFVLPGGGAS